MSGKAIKKIRKWYREELKTEAFKRHNEIWNQLNADLEKRLNLYRKAMAITMLLCTISVIAIIFFRR